MSSLDSERFLPASCAFCGRLTAGHVGEMFSSCTRCAAGRPALVGVLAELEDYNHAAFIVFADRTLHGELVARFRRFESCAVQIADPGDLAGFDLFLIPVPAGGGPIPEPVLNAIDQARKQGVECWPFEVDP
jgi:hypothetical protein